MPADHPGDLSTPHDVPEELSADRLLRTVSDAVAKMAKYGTVVTTELLGALGAVQYIGEAGAASMFVMKLACFYHSERDAKRLSDLITDLRNQISSLRTRGGLIDFSDSRNLEELFGKIEDYLSSREESKADLFRRVARNGIIRGSLSDREERDFRYIIRTLEMEDIDLLKRAQEIRKGPRPVITQDGRIPTVMNPDFIRKVELADVSTISLARLSATGLIENEVGYDELGLHITDSGTRFLGYLVGLNASTGTQV